MIKRDKICKYWTEDGIDEICKASCKTCSCGGNFQWYCDYPKQRRLKEENNG